MSFRRRWRGKLGKDEYGLMVTLGEYLRRSPHSEPSLDDYVCTPAEHAQAKECDELPYVQQYIDRENLVELAKQKLSVSSV